MRRSTPALMACHSLADRRTDLSRGRGVRRRGRSLSPTTSGGGTSLRVATPWTTGNGNSAFRRRDQIAAVRRPTIRRRRFDG